MSNFVLGVLLIILIYTGIHWLFIKLYLHEYFFENVILIYLPTLISSLFIYFYFSIKLKVFDRKKELIALIAFACFLIPFISSQYLLKSVSGIKIDVEYVDQIDSNQKAQYYTIKNYFLDKEKISYYQTYFILHRKNESTKQVLEVFITVPVLDNRNHKDQQKCTNWIGIRYEKQIETGLSQYTVTELVKEFINECIIKIKSERINFKYLEIIGNNYEREKFEKAVKRNIYFKDKNPKIFTPINSNFEYRNRTTYYWLIYGSSSCLLLYISLVLFLPISKNNLNSLRIKISKKNVIEYIHSKLEFILPNRKDFVFKTIVIINLLVMILILFSGYDIMNINTEDLDKLGAFNKNAIDNGEYWRFITSIFLSSSLMHLLIAIFFIYAISVNFEKNIGSTKFLFLYLVSVFIGNLSCYYFSTYQFSVGGIGGTFGIAGAIASFIITKSYSKKRLNSLRTDIFTSIILIIIIEIFLKNEIFNHLAGLLTGFIIGFIFSFQLKKKLN